jgi:type III secretion protein V
MRALEWLRGGGAGHALSRHSDILLAGLVVGIVAMMIIPLPTLLLDILITSNIALAVILLLVCIYVSEAIRFAALPSLLLIATLFRLGLNVSSTRLILLQADAGEVIRSFGEFVVSGNLVVGAVVFLILTLIQFIVIAKGSERVAEVAARFTLDAMPGKQMAIDADLRAGAIDLDHARRLRSGLQRESQLYGSMDGAMKFVKGDAIAGILITVINVVGGLLIGTLQRGMPVGEAATLYSILTIGDGLVSQIPALLISTGAGIVVTRVASEDEGAHLGKEIGEQVLAQPKAIAIASGLLALLAIVPGMPTLPFLTLAAATGALAYSLLQLARRKREGRRRVEQPLSEPGSELELPPPAPVALEVGAALTSEIDASSDGGRFMRELIPGLRELLHAELGVVLPGVRVRGDVPGLLPRGYRILLAEVPMASGEISEEQLRVLASPEALAAAGLGPAEATPLPGVAAPVCSLPAALAPAVKAAGLELCDPATQMVLHLGKVLREYAYELCGIQEAQELLDGLERTHPALVHEVVPKLVSIQTLADVLRRLVEESVSIRNLREILQALAEWGPVEKDPVVLVEYVRMSLRRYLSHRYGSEEKRLRAYLLDPAIEEAVRESIQKTDRGSYLAIEPGLSREIVEAVRRQLALEGDEPPPAVLTTMEIRRYVRRLLEVDFPELPVLSFTELLPELQIQPVARVSLS